MTATASASEAPPVGFLTKLAYAVGSTATNLKLRALSTFLVIFYNQVVGLPPAMVASILATALLLDAFLDPLLGQVSDNFRSRWGRRHPFMLAAALPYALCFFFLWNPPAGWSNEALGAYLLVLILGVRFFDTFFELPHQALAPELVRDYDGRTGLLALRHFFLVAGGLGMTIMAYQVFLKERPDGTGGVLARDGYFAYSLTGAAIIFTTIVVSVFGTAHRIPYLAPVPARKITVVGMLKEMAHTLNNRSFFAMVVASMFAAVAVGARNGLEIYFGLYFWGLKQSQLAGLATMSVIGGFAGAFLAPFVSRWLGKKWGAIFTWMLAVCVHITPVSLRLLGLAPANGTPELLVLLYTEEIVNATLAAVIAILLASLIADVVEDAEVKTGRRSEGLLLSANSLLRKAVSSGGVLVTGFVLTFINFPDKAERTQVSPETLTSLGLAYIPVIVGFYAVAIGSIMFYGINRSRHEANLDKLKVRASEQAAAEAGPGIGAGEAQFEAGKP